MTTFVALKLGEAIVFLQPLSAAEYCGSSYWSYLFACCTTPRASDADEERMKRSTLNLLLSSHPVGGRQNGRRSIQQKNVRVHTYLTYLR